jgi:hypothetical protein
MHLVALGLTHKIVEGNQLSSQNNTKVMIFLYFHLHDDVKVEYLTMKNPLVLWNNLKERFDEYNFTMFKINS